MMKWANANFPAGALPARDSSVARPERIAAARMAIINPDRIKAESLQYFCIAHWGFEVVAVESTAREGLAVVARTKPEVVLVSLALADLGAPEILRQFHAASPASKIIAQTTHCSEYFLHRISTAKYHALLHDAEEDLSSLGQAIDRARCGFRTVSSRIAQCQGALRTAPDAFAKLLSTREQEVLVCIAHSMSNEEIARQLGLSRATARTHRNHILRKLDIHSTPKLMRYCLEKGFTAVPPPSAALSKASP